MKKFIGKMPSLIKYSILFMLKKDDELRLFVDYRKLNEIIIKNITLLSNINKF